MVFRAVAVARLGFVFVERHRLESPGGGERVNGIFRLNAGQGLRLKRDRRADGDRIRPRSGLRLVKRGRGRGVRLSGDLGRGGVGGLNGLRRGGGDFLQQRGPGEQKYHADGDNDD